MREEEAAWRAAAERLHRQQEEYLQMLEREAALSGLTTEDVEVGRDQKQQTAAEAQQGTAVSMLKVQTRERELSAGVMELQLSLQDSLNLSAAASWRHTLELQLLAVELGALEEQLNGAACPHATSSVGAPPRTKYSTSCVNPQCVKHGRSKDSWICLTLSCFEASQC